MSVLFLTLFAMAVSLSFIFMALPPLNSLDADIARNAI
jgi:hypothetical protein